MVMPREVVREVRDGTRRICGSCDKRRRRTDSRCCVCARVRRRHASAAGQDYCGSCWTGMSRGAEALLATEIQAFLPRVDPMRIAEAIAATSASNPGRSLRLLLEFRKHAGEWLTNPAQGSSAFLGLYDQLRQHGIPLPPPACGHCGREAKLSHILGDLRCCQRCYVQGQRKPCDGCGRNQVITRRQPDGTGLCQACMNDLPDRTAKCSVCARHRPIAWNGHDGPVCSICRPRQRIDICRTCRTEKPCLFSGTPQARCHECSKRKERCSICAKDRQISSRTAAGEAVCKACGRAKEPCSDCGRTRVVVARIHGAPFCDYCHRTNPGFFRDCLQCGRHEKLRSNGHCLRCTADTKIAALFPPELLESNPQARSMHNAFLASDGSAVLRAFERTQSVRLLRSLLSAPNSISHATLDAKGTDQATRTVRSVLVEHGLLPPRDNNLARFEAWITSTAALIADPTERGSFVRFARWRHLRELRQHPTPIPSTTTTSRRRELRIVLELLDWTRQHGRTLATLTQADIDHWRATGHGERHRVKAFLTWAHRNRLCARLEITRVPGAGLSVAGLDPTERFTLLNRILSADLQAAPATRLSAALILLFGVRPHQITGLRLADVDRQGAKIHIRFGSEPLLLPDKIAELAAEVCQERRASRMISFAEDDEWLLPGTRPGYALSPAALTKRLRLIGVSPHRPAPGPWCPWPRNSRRSSWPGSPA